MGASYSKKPQEGKTVLITGANSGIGYNTALELGRDGANVICLCRDEGRGSKAVEDMKAAVPKGHYELELVDISNQQSVKDFVVRFEKRGVAVDTLINNAGIMMLPKRELSVDGFEMQWATNVLGHFQLTGLLLPSLQKSADPRVVNVSSLMAWTGHNKKDTFLDFVKDSNYHDEKVYGDTKLANLMFTYELAKRYPKLTVTAAHPGGTNTNLQQHKFGQWYFKAVMQKQGDGALPTLRAATDSAARSLDYFAPRAGGMGAAVYGWAPPYAKGEAQNAASWAALVKATKMDYRSKL